MNRTLEAISKHMGVALQTKSQTMKAVRIHNSVNLVTRTEKLSSA